MGWLSQAGAVAATGVLFLLIIGALLGDYADDTNPYGRDD